MSTSEEETKRNSKLFSHIFSEWISKSGLLKRLWVFFFSNFIILFKREAVFNAILLTDFAPACNSDHLIPRSTTPNLPTTFNIRIIIFRNCKNNCIIDNGQWMKHDFTAELCSFPDGCLHSQNLEDRRLAATLRSAKDIWEIKNVASYYFSLSQIPNKKNKWIKAGTFPSGINKIN